MGVLACNFLFPISNFFLYLSKFNFAYLYKKTKKMKDKKPLVSLKHK